jgi:hypothetical protein
MLILVAVQLLGSLLVGYAGRNRRLGFAGAFLLSLVLTPIVIGIGLALMGDIESPASDRVDTQRS